MKLAKNLLLLPAFLITGLAFAEINGEDIVNDAKYTCIACHSVENKIVGPSYKDIASKYENYESQAENLAKSIKNGSVNTYGAVPMPKNVIITEEEALAAAKYILSIK